MLFRAPLAALLASGAVSVATSLQAQPIFFEFSVDIGSDAELSDIQVEPIPDNVLDPGDIYLWNLPPSPIPFNGFKDDLLIFGLMDPAPTPGVGNNVPIGMAGPAMYPDFFDLDGHDQIDIDLRQFIPPDFPVQEPIQEFGSQCIHPPFHLVLSYDDDKAAGWPVADVPVFTYSPTALLYGLTPFQDEIIEVDLMAPAPPMGILGMYGVSDEREIHLNLSPNPNIGGNAADDDIDSLDGTLDPGMCPFWYWTCDHEATWFDPFSGAQLDPGDIYLVQPAGPAAFFPIIDAQIHLGLRQGTDLDAFEFTWLFVSPDLPLVLGILFSVDEDDPLTPLPIDESGGLNPAMIYYSLFNGMSQPALMQPLRDDVDALTVVPIPVPPTQLCNGDASGDGMVNITDLNIVIGNWGTSPLPGTNGDCNGDGLVNILDLNLVLGNFGQIC